MKIVKVSLVLVAAAALMIGLSTAGYAFHSGGAAECMGCHEMHGAAGSSLLIGADQSSTCLTCHGKSGQSSYHIATPQADMPAGSPPVNMTPGGDFGWLKKDYFYSSHGEAGSDYGQHHGHSIIAASFDGGYTVDTDNPVAPGGTFNSNNLHCNSCHDQHGQARRLSDGTFAMTGAPIIGSGSYDSSAVPTAGQAVGVYRLLRSNISDQGHAAGHPTFINTPVQAFAPSTYNRSEFYTMTRVAYNDQMSKFCGSCHPDMHVTTGINRHPQDVALDGVLSNYNSYVKSGDMTNDVTKSFLSLVPYEEGVIWSTANIATLQSHAKNNDSVLQGPGATAKVMCLSCHRAHATAFPEMTRWENETEIIAKNGAWSATNGKSQTEENAGYNNFDASKMATYQRSLCNKCHAKD